MKRFVGLVLAIAICVGGFFQNSSFVYATEAVQQNMLEKAVVYKADRLCETGINVYFFPVQGAEKYIIFRSVYPEEGYQVLAQTAPENGYAYFDANAPADMVFYYKVCAVKTVSGLPVYGELSDACAATTWADSKLAELFPYGLPKSPAEMQNYLTVISVPIVDTNGRMRTKNLKVHKYLAPNITAAFTEMAMCNIPVRASDTASYNWRRMTSVNLPSHHSYGCAIDINWKSNPYVQEGRDYYKAGFRPGVDPYSVNTQMVEIWKKYGFEWGGNWHISKDFMHFTYTGH